MKGLRVIPDVISEEQEKDLLAYIDAQEWDTRYKQRRTQYYGLDYEYRTRHLSKLGPIPAELLPEVITEHISPEGIIINEYYDGSGISQHKDALCWGNRIVILSLGADTVMTMHGNVLAVGINLPRRSILIMEDGPRYKLEHSISHKGERRVSLTYRTVAPGVTVAQ